MVDKTDSIEKIVNELITSRAFEEIEGDIGKTRVEQMMNRYKKDISKRTGVDKLLKNSEILKYLKDKRIKKYLIKKPTKTISGVAVIAVMTSPADCPHGRCIMCPGGLANNTPQSYTGFEPAALRGAQCNYDPYLQVRHRLEQLYTIGHPIGKVELIVMGGTFTSRDLSYQEYFIKECLRAMNEFYEDHGQKDKNQIVENEMAKIRNVGITFETRPDYCREKEIDTMLNLGGTKVELGVQTVYDYILEKIKRGHTVKDSIKANRLLRDSGLKVGFHMMLGLPSSDFDRDYDMFYEIYNNEDFKPDYLKIYPTLVTKGTELYDWWKKGLYKPCSTEDAVKLITEIKKITPPWVRIQRIQRDIPAPYIVDGVKKSNIRQMAQEILIKENKRCRCIRCREVGHVDKEPENIDLSLIKYDCSGGEEFFISYEDIANDILIGFTRLRFPASPYRREINKDTALIRELHIYGQMLNIGERSDDEDKKIWQHRNYGRLLISKAEEIAKDNGFKKLVICSGIGVREYYRKLGYSRDGIYMSKYL
ncbi:MAG: tRNA uridine(34) 5-carboxymethylaminomethyl modification radical SAM/GNAT enzyme Elp3 [Candidatus Methanoliparum thermophilum]|uniref:tRNA carboxymethyluridine synthase n=1 Tax=Methanoliparum thermophilum TaxID=2491083 RepID=A0A520KQJ1_METT2|nr:tRNA uridine(34) 5-carboxymethylaminomethyl modification radical SAM/GNAT enzyme Elp3 [Candidatus Methanoliparum sp. LAM-1]RZN63831.1 MAG: tRNA uridine(34) 5-carboxymethylaminomethyl modification radical SAM/GNAT enzyme Elp3 [Candidatus Methanoliparum thermophilum]BDC36445.1 tRNA uridine(34) 5-carboxymethylaminomethyl modification radical SAM/GNAT enzyme Elp3 [Candidatus Methanoliparum sp. LAM-1]